ncbi:YgiQ family radical SAM protein [Isachenkonia alkalipeptolytica]|uniref:YgiQ family radical SAM protein n=1 Tax=Isachenkonia alkalipeptolytica TaxID=2565777 RepID=A0AA43XIT7_9CLOT|nr:YgiQ family radical SAM protein [Isachenkonia alkalipeptolytica]NBG86994.1 YgiQ family radical SAM protein [Isachenkonia alkalipeptolytica]
MNEEFLPLTREDLSQRGWDSPDFILVTGDAYIDHPSFGSAIISRLLEAKGYRVGIIAQPDWKKDGDFLHLGKPKYGFLVTGGNVDSMVNHYSVGKKRRRKDVYSPGGKPFLRPDRASTVYTNRLKSLFKDTPIILGGIEASLRRLAHYDYWENKVRRSILLDSKADLIVYGMGEKPIVEIAEGLEAGIPVEYLQYIPGTVFKTGTLEDLPDYKLLPSFEEITENKKAYAKSFMLQYRNTDNLNGEILVEPYGNQYVVQNLPAEPMDKEALDRIYRLPFTRKAHKNYDALGGVPAIEEVQYSITSNRGCFGGCSFCALTFHQGRKVRSRSHESVMEEAAAFLKDPDFKGYIHDVGGPTANFQNPACDKQEKHGVCKDKQCLFPGPCSQLKVDHQDYVHTLRELRSLPGVKKVFIRSGIRYDYLMADQNKTFFKELVQHHVSGQLKVAPEHVSSRVLNKMGKPSKKVYDGFAREYFRYNQAFDKNQFLVPYFISSHPGSELRDAIQLAEYIRDMGYMPEQVQDFYPTPGTLSTCMYYTGLDPRTMERVYVPRSSEEKAMQRALIQFQNPKNRSLVKKALIRGNRSDLIGSHPKALVPGDASSKKSHKEPKGKRPHNRK